MLLNKKVFITEIKLLLKNIQKCKLNIMDIYCTHEHN